MRKKTYENSDKIFCLNCRKIIPKAKVNKGKVLETGMTKQEEHIQQN